MTKTGRPRSDNDALILLALSFMYGGYYQADKKLGWGNQKRVRNRVKRMLEKHGQQRADLIEIRNAIERFEKSHSSIYEKFYADESVGERLETSDIPVTVMYIIHNAKLYGKDKQILALAEKASDELLALSPQHRTNTN